MKYKMLVFDLDGTLVNSIPDISEVFNSVLDKNGFPVYQVESYYSLVGWGLKRTLELVLPQDFADPQLFDSMLGEVVQSYSDRPARSSYVYPGIRQLLADLENRQVEMVVYTNKVTKIAKAVVQNLIPGISFQKILGNTGKYPAKPDSTALDLYLAGKDLELSSILMVGDTPVDRETAGNAGIDFAGVTWGFRSEQELLASGSLLNFTRPEELQSWLLKEEHYEI